MGARGTERSGLMSVLGGPTQGMTRGQGQAKSSHLDFSLRASGCVEVGASQTPPSFGLFLSCVHQQILSGRLSNHQGSECGF